MYQCKLSHKSRHPQGIGGRNGNGEIRGVKGRLEKSPANARLRRLLACTDTDELVMCLRPVLSLIQSRVTSGNLNYAFLLRDLVKFYYDPDRIKKSWANSFYKVVYKPKE